MKFVNLYKLTLTLIKFVNHNVSDLSLILLYEWYMGKDSARIESGMARGAK